MNRHNLSQNPYRMTTGIMTLSQSIQLSHQAPLGCFLSSLRHIHSLTVSGGPVFPGRQAEVKPYGTCGLRLAQHIHLEVPQASEEGHGRGVHK